MAGFTKLCSTILTSTIWREDHATRIVWVTMLALADQEGHVGGSIPGLAAFANVSLDECKAALAKLAAPDEYSRTRTAEGRRIEECAGGWKLINYLKYREQRNKEARREYQRNWKAERDRPRSTAGDSSRQASTVGDQNEVGRPESTQAEAEAEAEADSETDEELASDPNWSRPWISDHPPFSKDLGRTFFLEWPGAEAFQFTESAAKAEAAFANNITEDVYPAFCDAFDLVLEQYAESKAKDRRKVLGSFRTFCERRWRDVKPPAAPPRAVPLVTFAVPSAPELEV